MSAGLLLERPPAARPLPAGTTRYRHQALLAVLPVLAVVVLAVSQRGTLAAAAAALGRVDWRWLPLVLLAELASKTAVAATHRRLLRAAGHPLRLCSLLAVVYGGNALSMTVPVVGAELGAAFGFGQLTRRGVTRAAAGWTLLVSGFAAAGSFALLAVAGAAATGTGWGTAIGAGTGLLVVGCAAGLVAALRSPDLRRTLLTLAARAPDRLPAPARRSARRVAAALPPLLEQLAALRLPGRDRTAVLLLALVNWAVDALCLAAAVAASGAPVPWHALLLAYLTAAGVSTLAITPGGLGTVELALTAALVAAGLDAQHALTAALLYRLVTLWLATAAGWVAYAALSRTPRPGAAGGRARARP